MDKFEQFSPVDGALRLRTANDLIEEAMACVVWGQLTRREVEFCRSLYRRVLRGGGATKRQLEWFADIVRRFDIDLSDRLRGIIDLGIEEDEL